MSETSKGIRDDLRALKQRLIIWLIKKLLGRKSLKSPVDILWDMIDEENSNGSLVIEGGEPVPDCSKIEAWEEAAARIGREEEQHRRLRCLKGNCLKHWTMSPWTVEMRIRTRYGSRPTTYLGY